ncbi:ATP-binding cassette sub-family C member 5-like [Glandiceps talaboti]
MADMATNTNKTSSSDGDIIDQNDSTPRPEEIEYSGAGARTYSYAEALQCHDFDLSTSPQGGGIHFGLPGKSDSKVNTENTSKNENLPIGSVGILSYVFLTWLTPLVKKAYKQGLKMDNLWKCAKNESAEYTSTRMDQLWKKELQKNGKEKASMVTVFAKFSKTQLFLSIMGLLCYDVFYVISTVIMHALLVYVQGEEYNLPYELWLCFALLTSQAITAVAASTFWMTGVTYGIRVRSGMIALIYKKILRLRNVQDKTVGEIVNLSTNDSMRLFDACRLVTFLVGGFVLTLLCICCATYILGHAALVGSTLFLLSYPLQVISSKFVTYFRIRTIKITDKRVRMINEMITCVKLIKMYAWEKPFARKIAGIRKKEKQLLRKAGVIQSINESWNPLLQVGAVILTFSIYIYMGNDLTPAMAYTVIALFALTRIVLTMFPILIKDLAESFVAADRLKNLLLMEELQPYESKPFDDDVAVDITMATFAWDKQEKEQSKEERKLMEEEKMMTTERIEEDSETSNGVPILFDINLKLKKGQLIGICGSVGSGKSSLISAILAQTQLISGEVAIDGSIAYVPQQAWITNTTLKENILFGNCYDKKMYEDAVFAACLQEDIDKLPSGDDTEIGERGINLSGGQKQRVSLARALYANRDIYLLDDPLSAVDTRVGKHIFNIYVKGGLSGKSVLFITHQLQYLSGCDHILMMKDGRIVENGHHNELIKSGGQYATLIDTFHANERSDKSEDVCSQNMYSHSDSSECKNNHKGSLVHTPIDLGNSNENVTRSMSDLNNQYREKCNSASSLESRKSVINEDHNAVINTHGTVDGRLMTEEEKREGDVTWKTYHCYIKEAGGYGVAFVVLFLFLASGGCITATSWWLGYWIILGNVQVTNSTTNYTETLVSVNLAENTDVTYFVTVYVGILAAVLVFTVLKCLFYVAVSLKASSKLHDKVFQRVFHSPMSFFDTTPSGRILNRFSQDQDQVDVQLRESMQKMLDNMILVFFNCLSIIIVYPWFLLACIPFAILFILCFKYFHHAVRDCKRLENISRSPWISHITATVQGLPVIQAFSKQNYFEQKFDDLLDTNIAAFYTFWLCGRWVGIRLDIIAICTAVFTAILTISTHGQIPPSYAGIALSYAILFVGLFQNAVRLTVDLQARFTSVERINYYIQNLKPEAPPILLDQRPPEHWPQEGKLQVKNLKMSYRNNLPMALRGVNFKVESMEKIGIVGRTGAGKSSIGVSLFRLVEAISGSIYIDDINISAIGLQDLRSRLSVIPQDPVLFVGSIRYNLDPFDQYSDPEIWTALEKCLLKNTILELEGKLASPVVENGENFSVGERQLICMARALLRRSKILLLDEATAAVDTETDSLIQQTIRDAFKDCTMLIIAHRLNTVLNCDKILVMDDGKVVEFDTPTVLLANHNSQFSRMMAASEKPSQYLT